MALARILVDGYSLLHNWPELSPGKAPHSAAARAELIKRLTQYHDAIGTPITIFFDGSQKDAGLPDVQSTSGVEILYSCAGQTADQMIERTTHRLHAYGEVLAVTDDHAERETVMSLGGTTSSCLNFIQTVESTLAEMEREIKWHNLHERDLFNRSRNP